MSKDLKEITKNEVEKIRKNAEIDEAYFVGLLWSDPFTYYSEYHDRISQEEFIHDIWGFFFELGRRMYRAGVKKFDDITVHKFVKELNVIDEFNKYGQMEHIEYAIQAVGEHSENIEHYYETIKRNHTIRQLVALFGEKVLVNKGNYRYNEMTREQLYAYWNDKVNKIGLDSVNRYEAEDLVIDADEFIRRLEEDSAEMLPYYNSYLLNSISQGVPRGHVTMIGSFGNTGKSSFVFEKFVMSCIANKEKLLVILNEEDAQAFRQKMVLSILFHEFKTGFDRKKLVNGKLGEKEKDLIRKAFARADELINGERQTIKLVFMERYVMRDLEKIVRFWANRGYINLLIDTHKVSDDSQYEKRWETFVEDMKTIYRLTRKNAGGLNLRTVVTFQLADSAVKHRYLDFEAIGEGKAAKNEASIVYMFRPCFADEYIGGSRELECYRLKWNENGKPDKEFFKLDRGKTYYLLFTPKNRFGLNTDNGQPVLVMEPNFNFNHFKEIGWCYVPNDKSGR